ncbi:MAG: molecular chaperone HtpG [Alphaproteobacteria bacterium]|nr:molecular chaperone HtpG [Alphaproteobacteria bacterium]
MATKTREKSTEEKHEFQAEVAKLLHLMVHSVYSERDVFLRELISNAADACDKLRYEAISQPEILAGDTDLQITITADKKAKTLTIADNGIGMNRDELIDNLGTIARSGTKAFMDAVAAGKEKSGEVNLIGQFGVGFYSAFMVADTVEVRSRRAGEKAGWLWTSDGSGSFSVTENEDDPSQGTAITLNIKKEAKEFLEPLKIEKIVRDYSDHVAIPIKLIEVEKGKPGEVRQINEASALWTRAKKDITKEQYREFFGHVSGLFGDPAITIHYRAEGRHEYQVLLFVPAEKPYDLYDPERRGRQKLYVRKVFISEDADILPPWLRFVRGVIDSEDMPLNISREMLQNNPIVGQIRKAVTKRVLTELKKFAKKDPIAYAGVWSSVGPVLKEGIYEDMERRDELFELARFTTTASTEATPVRTLADYVADMKDNQTAIYYITGEDADAISASPHLEGFRARGVEVLLLSDPIDSFWTANALGYEGKPFRSITQGIADLDSIDPEAEEGEKETKPKSKIDEEATSSLIAAMKTALGEKVSDVRESKRLTDSPVCLIAGDGGLDRNLEKLLSRQQTPGVQVSAPVLEINPSHGLVQVLAEQAKKGGDTALVDDAARLLLDQAFILDGEPVGEPMEFAKRMTNIMQRAFGS